MTHTSIDSNIAPHSTPKRTVSTTRSIELDFVRGVAILLAVGWHFNVRDTGLWLFDNLMLPGRLFGWAGVDLFFVLSGFLVGGLIFREYRDSLRFHAGRFLIRRAFKIWPVLYAYILLLLLTGRYEAHQIVPQTLLHVQNYFLTPLNHLWSLAVEEHFYTLFSALFALLVTGGRVSVLSVPRLLFFLMLFVPVLRGVAALMGASSLTLQIQTQFRIDALACGVWLAHMQVYSPSRFQWLAAKKLLLMLVVAGGVTFLCIQQGGYLLAVVGYTLTYLAGAAFLLLCYQSKYIVGANWLARMVAWIGTYSYAMYVFQFVPIRVAEAIWRRLDVGVMPAGVEVAVRYVGAIALAGLVTLLLERPMLRLRNRLFPALSTPQ